MSVLTDNLILPFDADEELNYFLPNVKYQGKQRINDQKLDDKLIQKYYTA